jgi:hypothetical protein
VEETPKGRAFLRTIATRATAAQLTGLQRRKIRIVLAATRELMPAEARGGRPP